jgi:acetyl-CoA decarbonylase/synthase, CODH/ACS complex subunit gamma
MALTGLQIQKLLPKTNCKECGSNTCLAFAMKLAAQKTALSQCPYASEEAKQVLGAASEPPVKCIALGTDQSLKLGAETVLYRHEKTFVHQTALAVNVNDTDPAAAVQATLEAIRDYTLVRVGQTLTLNAVGVTQRGSDNAAFVALAAKAHEITKRPLILRSANLHALTEAATAVKGTHSIVCAPSPAAAVELAPVAKENGHALAILAPDLDSLAAATAQIKQSGFNDLVLVFQTYSLAEQFQTNSLARRAALRQSFKALGYPSLYVINNADLMEATVEAVTEVDKYGGILLLPAFDPAQISVLMTLRLNIYTDPQKPIQVEPKLYAIGEPTPQSPVFVTTNFSLTYFIVSGEIENSGTSAWLLVPECEGLSVLTAWAAGKFSGAVIGKFAKECRLEDQVQGRTMIIPGHVAQISGELEEAMPGWKVLVGPQEAGDLESFIKSRLAK